MIMLLLHACDITFYAPLYNYSSSSFFGYQFFSTYIQYCTYVRTYSILKFKNHIRFLHVRTYFWCITKSILFLLYT